jgi:hypothetical protein
MGKRIGMLVASIGILGGFRYFACAIRTSGLVNGAAESGEPRAE